MESTPKAVAESIVGAPPYADWTTRDVYPLAKHYFDSLDLVRSLKNALARERGGGSPLSTKEYIMLNDRARKFLS